MTRPRPTIETVGAIVRARNGALLEILEVLEWTRCSEQHSSRPGDVVVRVRPHGPGYNRGTAWAGDLAPSQPGDIGAHPHGADCPCGARPFNPQPWCHWVPVAASWKTRP